MTETTRTAEQRCEHDWRPAPPSRDGYTFHQCAKCGEVKSNETLASKTQLQVSPEVAAYNEQWRVFKDVVGKHCFDPATLGTEPSYLENRLRLTFEVAWNGAMNWVESRTLREIKNDK